MGENKKLSFLRTPIPLLKRGHKLDLCAQADEGLNPPLTTTVPKAQAEAPHDKQSSSTGLSMLQPASKHPSLPQHQGSSQPHHTSHPKLRTTAPPPLGLSLVAPKQPAEPSQSRADGRHQTFPGRVTSDWIRKSFV